MRSVGGGRRLIALYALTALAALGAVGLGLLLLGPGAWLLAGGAVRRLTGKPQADALDATRRTLLAAAAGAATLVGVGFTARTYHLSRRGQLTDRYGRAVELLAADEPTALVERLAGIFALEQVMAESARDHETVVAVLAAFVRWRAPVSEEDRPPPAAPEEDVRAALAVLARRPARHELHRLDLRRTELSGLGLPPGARLRRADLTGARLVGAQLPGADLQEALLDDADLSGAGLTEADLTGAWLKRARLSGAQCGHATLTGALLSDAELEDTRLVKADLSESWLDAAELPHAMLSGARLDGACLQNAALDRSDGLTKRQLLSAQLWDTGLPEGLAHDPEVQAHEAACKSGPTREKPRHPVHGGRHDY